MAFIGQIPYFYGGGDWTVFSERLDQFFEVNDIDDVKKRALLLTALDDQIYKTLRDLCHPQLPKDKTYAELIDLLNKQFVVRTSVFRERAKFYLARQYANESISNWFARIKNLSVDCKFGEQFDVIMLDRFISGLRATSILDRLCEEAEDLTIQKAVEIATSKESSSSGNQEPDDNSGDDDDEDKAEKTKKKNRRRGKKN